MAKSGIKKALKITAWVVGVFLALDLLLVGLLFIPPIQTFVVHTITAAISEKWGTELSIGDVRITPTLKMVAHKVPTHTATAGRTVDDVLTGTIVIIRIFVADLATVVT